MSYPSTNWSTSHVSFCTIPAQGTHVQGPRLPCRSHQAPRCTQTCKPSDPETLIVSENLCRLAASVCLKGPHARSSPDQPRAARLQQGGLGPPCVSNSAPTGSFSTSTETVRLCAVACTCRRSLACAARVVTPESGAKNVLHKDGGGRAAAGSCRARAAAAAGARREPAGTGAWRASGRSPAAGRQSPAAAGAAAPCGSLAARLVPQHCPAWV